MHSKVKSDSDVWFTGLLIDAVFQRDILLEWGL